MREIKLRFWDEENNCMVYQDKNGLYPNSFYKIECDLFTGFQFKLFRLSKLNQFSEALNRFEEVESVKMQYTGLKDLNGTEVYEGDIVEFIHSGEKHISKIYYKHLKGYYFKFKYNNDDYLYEFNISDLDVKHRETKVIGNIYKNPELLEER